jgi:pyruvate,water dikinase
MTQKLHEAGVAVPAGFAISVAAYWEFVEANGLQKKIAATLDEYKQGRQSLTEVGQAIRTEFLNGDLPAARGCDSEPTPTMRPKPSNG